MPTRASANTFTAGVIAYGKWDAATHDLLAVAADVRNGITAVTAEANFNLVFADKTKLF